MDLMDDRIEQLSRAVERIEERNARVEAEKAWETSFARISIISLIIYLGVGLMLISLKVKLPFLNPLIPVFGYILSMQTLPVIKKRWIASFKKRNS